MTIGHDQAIARKMNKLRMFDIAKSIHAAACAVLNDNAERFSMEDYESVEWLKEACDEWTRYVEETRRELGIHAD